MKILIAMVIVVVSCGFAGAGENGRHGDHNGGIIDVDIRIGVDARRVIENYYRDSYRHCPPGLAKKNRDCLPPGQEKKRYTVGAALPSGIMFGPLPGALTQRLPPPPRGYLYGYVDGDILLMAEATHRVVDAIVAIDALMNAR